MSDRAPVQVKVYDLGDEDGKAVRDTLIGLGLDLDFGMGAESEVLELDSPYGDDEMVLTSEQDIADALIASYPTLTFEVWQDPKYEWDGAIVMYAPDLGRYDGTCNADGEVYLKARNVRDGITAGDIDRTAGLAWLDRIDELRERLEKKEAPVG